MGNETETIQPISGSRSWKANSRAASASLKDQSPSSSFNRNTGSVVRWQRWELWYLKLLFFPLGWWWWGSLPPFFPHKPPTALGSESSFCHPELQSCYKGFAKKLNQIGTWAPSVPFLPRNTTVWLCMKYIHIQLLIPGLGMRKQMSKNWVLYSRAWSNKWLHCHSCVYYRY